MNVLSLKEPQTNVSFALPLDQQFYTLNSVCKWTKFEVLHFPVLNLNMKVS